MLFFSNNISHKRVTQDASFAFLIGGKSPGFKPSSSGKYAQAQIIPAR